MTTDKTPSSSSPATPAAVAQTQTSSSQPIPISLTSTSERPPQPHLPRRTSSSFSSASSPAGGNIPTRHPRPQNVADFHQELEREQEGIVNRLLGQITVAAHNVSAAHPGTNTDDVAAAAIPLSASPQLSAPIHHSSHPPSVTDMPSSFSPAIGRSRSPAPDRTPSGTYHQSHSRHNSLSTRSRTSSHTSSPLLLPVGMESSVWPVTAADPFLMGGRDEVAFYKTETDMLVRENEMLKRRIRELEEKAGRLNESAAVSSDPTKLEES